MRKTSSEEGASFRLATSSPVCSDQAPSVSSDSGLSVASQGRGGVGQSRGPARDKFTQAGKLLSGLDFEIAQPPVEVMTDLAASCGWEGETTGGESELGHAVNGEASSGERETDILDDEDDVDGVAPPASDMPSSSGFGSLPSDNLPQTERSAHAEYSTHSWVRQQQMVDVGGEMLDNGLRKPRPSARVAPNTPRRGHSSREAAQRGPASEDGAHSVPQNTDVTHNAQSVHAASAPSCQDEDLSSLNTDADESIEQLNRLILDLDPTFVPVPTRCAPVSRSASLHSNGLSHKGDSHRSGETAMKKNKGRITPRFKRYQILV